MSRAMKAVDDPNEIRCPTCQRFTGASPWPVVVTGTVKVAPPIDQREGHFYSQCATCRTFVRWEVKPPEDAKKELAKRAA